MGYALTEEQELIQQTAREFSQEYIEPVAAEMDKSALYPDKIVQHLAEHGFMSMFLPEQYGGAEAGFLTYMLIVEELAKASGAVASILNHHSALVTYSIMTGGTEEQKEKYLPALASGEILGAFALEEPDAAPGVGRHKVVAHKDGSNYVLNGQKCYVANGDTAGVYVVFALTDQEKKLDGMSAFLVDQGVSGLTVTRTIKKMGLRGCQMVELNFDNVQVAADAVLGFAGRGMEIAAQAQAVFNIAEGAMAVGIAQAALDDVVQYGKQRIQFKRPIITFPAIQSMVAEMAANIYAARLAVYDAASLMDREEPFDAEAAMVKLFAGRMGKSALIDVVQVEGGYGYSEDMAASRFFRDIKGVAIKNSTLDFPEGPILKRLLE